MNVSEATVASKPLLALTATWAPVEGPTLNSYSRCHRDICGGSVRRGTLPLAWCSLLQTYRSPTGFLYHYGCSRAPVVLSWSDTSKLMLAIQAPGSSAAPGNSSPSSAGIWCHPLGKRDPVHPSSQSPGSWHNCPLLKVTSGPHPEVNLSIQATE